MGRQFVQRHLPLITSRIEFQLTPLPPLPKITPHIEFTVERLARSRRALESKESSREPKRRRVSISHRVSVEDPGSEGDSEDSDNSTTQPSSLLAPSRSSSLIPKPAGEPGRPGSGGFCMEDVLIDTHKWPKEAVADLTRAVKAEAKEKLDMTVSFRGQSKKKVDAICMKEMRARDMFPELENYEDCWPVRSILKLTLKYMAESSRRTATKDTNSRVRNVLGLVSEAN